jgi:Amt family ammonium transporter
MLLTAFITWQQSRAADTVATTSAPASQPAVEAKAGTPTSSLPSYFYGYLVGPDGKPTSDTEHVTAAQDPTGSTYGVWATPSSTFYADKKGDDAIAGDNPSKMTVADLYDRVIHNQYALNMVWTLIEGFLVMFMQLGFAMVETGLCRAKNAGHTFAMNMMIYPLGCLAFYVYGFAIGWGNWWNGPAGPGWYPALGPGLSLLNSGWGLTIAGHTWGIIGTKGFFLSGCSDVSVMALFFFMMVFMDTTATIPTGTMAERWTWGNFCLFGLIVALPYCLLANWVWGGGWLAALGVNKGWGNGAVDFAGSGVVHLMGGVIAVAGGLAIGPRIGKYLNGKPQAIPGHDLPMVMGGTFVLCFGWFGFNPGSTLSGTDLRISFVVVNTMLAGIVAALASMVVMWIKFKKPDPSMMCNGMLAGLVAITAPCAFVSPLASVIIGAIAGVLVVYSVFFWDNMGIDDCVGAISVHGVNGLWGLLCVGIFANGDYGAGFGGITDHGVTGILPIGAVGSPAFFSAVGWQQLLCQSIDGLCAIVVGMGIMYPFFKISNAIVPLRVSRDVELQGLDMPEMGALAYPDFELKTTPSITEIAHV